MRVWEGFDNLPGFRNPVVTIGSYDGLHAGHRALLDNVRRIAVETGGESVVVTFSPHPRQVLSRGDDKPFILSTLREKAYLLEQAGIDNMIVADFTEEFSRLATYEFVKQYIVGKIGVKTLVVGCNHHLGHRQQGNYAYMEGLSAVFGFDIFRQLKTDVGTNKVSSTIVRRLISSGDMTGAARLLTRPYLIIGNVDPGGRIVLPEPMKLLPPVGQYPVRVMCGGAQSDGKLYIDALGRVMVNADTCSPGEIIINFC